jgi:hypothetical protein
MPNSGLYLYGVYSNNYPTTYGNLISVRGGGAGELLLEWTASNTCGRIHYRSKRDNTDNGWTKWSKVAWTSDLDSYLPLSGGTMSGNILVGKDNTYNLGSSSYKWANIYTTNVNTKNITFTAETMDAAKIYTTIDGAATYVDFYLADDNNSDAWRWRFKPSGGTEYSAMTLLSTEQGKAKLTVAGTVVATTFTGALNGNATSATTATSASNSSNLGGYSSDRYFIRKDRTMLSNFSYDLNDVTSLGFGAIEIRNTEKTYSNAPFTGYYALLNFYDGNNHSKM